jgi:hypothetical protein
MPAIKFSQSNKERIVWNPETNRAAAEFINGEFQTDDLKVQELLLHLGYKKMATMQQALEDSNSPPQSAFKGVVPSTEVGGAAIDVELPQKVRKKTAFTSTEEAESTKNISSGAPRPQPAMPRRAGTKREKP